MEALTAVNWAAIQRLRSNGVPERTVVGIIKANGLDLPHQPAIQPTYQPAGRDAADVPQWTVYCTACTLEYGVLSLCQFGMWDAPAVLVAPAPLLRVVNLALTGVQDDHDQEGAHRA
jgi:hypothetical protein